MNYCLKSILAASLLGSTAIVSAAHAQALNDPTANPEACESLRVLNDENETVFNEEFVVGARDVVARDDALECAPWLAEAERALEENDGANLTATAGRIVVTQPEPNVVVDQADPQVLVDQAEPQVTVDQGRPEIIVRQAQPTVRVEMPRPTITIDQPQPEIIVRMPDPSVAVSTPEPQIEVRQADPTVRVDQAQPQIAVQEPNVAVEDRGEANVRIEAGQPVVRHDISREQAAVNVQESQPIVRYEQAEPNIEFEETGEPNIQFSQSGEPNIRIEEARPGETDRYAMLRVGPTPVEAGPAADVVVGDVVGVVVVDLQGETVGEIENVVDVDGRMFAVLTDGGVLGLGETVVAIPLDALSMRGEEVVLRGMTDEDIQAMPEFDPATGETLAVDRTVQITNL